MGTTLRFYISPLIISSSFLTQNLYQMTGHGRMRLPVALLFTLAISCACNRIQRDLSIQPDAKPSFLQFNNQKDTRGTTVNLASMLVNTFTPENCLGDLMLTGYSNDNYGEDDYGYQASCMNKGEANRLTCFPSTATVITDGRGIVSMDSLAIGDLILTYDFSRGMTKYERVLFFLHQDPKVNSRDWLSVTHTHGTLTLSSRHLVFKQTHSEIDSWTTRSVMAKSLKPGDIISLVIEGLPTSTKVHSVVAAGVHTGIYAPVTESGTLFVDGVLASSYAALDIVPKFAEEYQHILFNGLAKPLKLLSQNRSVASAVAYVLSSPRGTSSKPRNSDIMDPIIGRLESTYTSLSSFVQTVKG